MEEILFILELVELASIPVRIIKYQRGQVMTCGTGTKTFKQSVRNRKVYLQIASRSLIDHNCILLFKYLICSVL